jgi:hypothetical protein
MMRPTVGVNDRSYERMLHLVNEGKDLRLCLGLTSSDNMDNERSYCRRGFPERGPIGPSGT